MLKVYLYFFVINKLFFFINLMLLIFVIVLCGKGLIFDCIFGLI